MFWKNGRRRELESVVIVDALEVGEAAAAAYERSQSDPNHPREREWFAVATEYVKVERYNCGKEDALGFVLLFLGLGGFGAIYVEPLLAFPAFIFLYAAFYQLVMRRFADGKFNWCCSCVFLIWSCNEVESEGEEFGGHDHDVNIEDSENEDEQPQIGERDIDNSQNGDLIEGTGSERISGGVEVHEFDPVGERNGASL